MKRPLPKTEEEISAWADAIRRERVSETGRRLIDLVELAVVDAAKAKGDDASGRLYMAVDKLVRASFQADKQHNDNTLDSLRKRLDTGAKLAEDLDGYAH